MYCEWHKKFREANEKIKNGTITTDEYKITMKNTDEICIECSKRNLCESGLCD